MNLEKQIPIQLCKCIFVYILYSIIMHVSCTLELMQYIKHIFLSLDFRHFMYSTGCPNLFLVLYLCLQGHWKIPYYEIKKTNNLMVIHSLKLFFIGKCLALGNVLHWEISALKIGNVIIKKFQH